MVNDGSEYLIQSYYDGDRLEQRTCANLILSLGLENGIRALMHAAEGRDRINRVYNLAGILRLEIKPWSNQRQRDALQAIAKCGKPWVADYLCWYEKRKNGTVPVGEEFDLGKYPKPQIEKPGNLGDLSTMYQPPACIIEKSSQ